MKIPSIFLQAMPHSAGINVFVMKECVCYTGLPAVQLHFLLTTAVHPPEKNQEINNRAPHTAQHDYQEVKYTAERHASIYILFYPNIVFS